jgi:Mycothiol maleylpyruvate isomerase N-terminal domain
MTDTFMLIADRRICLADHFSSLTEAQWATPSLCAGWRTREVLAHLVMPFEMSTPAFLWQLARKKGFTSTGVVCDLR